MVMCFAPDCKHYSERDSCRFFVFPKDPVEKKRWLKLLRIHIFGNRFCAKVHPDSKAILHEAEAYSRHEVLDLTKTLKGFESTQELDAFVQQKAEFPGKIIPQSGVDEDYDKAEQAVTKLQDDAKDYLKEEERFFGCKACMTDNDDEEEKDNRLQSVTLLYELREGNCPKPYGFNVAKLADLPKSVIQRAQKVAADREEITKRRRLVCELLTGDAANARRVISSLQKN